jgi:hypothetical protein
MNVLYDFGRQSFLDGLIGWTSMTIRAALIDTTQYQVDLANHQWLSDIGSVAIVATSPPLANKTVTAGVANADPVTFTGVSGPTCAVMVIYRDTGVASTSRLIAYLTQATGLPVSPNGGNIVVSWDTAANKIFKL